MTLDRIRLPLCRAALAVIAIAGPIRAELLPDWIARLPVGSSLSAGLAGIVVDPDGVSYVTGTSGPSSNTDVTTAAFSPDGALLWSQTFNGPQQNWHDQARGIALGPEGVVWVTGNTPGPGLYANVLLLAYDGATGDQLDFVQYSSGPFTSEHGASVAVGADGSVYVLGGTVGDGADAMMLKFDAAGNLAWRETWDGPPNAPFSGDAGLEVLLDPAGDPVAMIYGIMSSLHPDYVVVKYAAADGATLWDVNWGVSGGDSPNDMKIDAAGDVYVTGTGLDFNDRFSTIKLRGSDGVLLWQAYDWAGIDDSGRALALDGEGGVYITGAVDPDGDESNFNDNVYTVKRDAVTGGQIWTHLYGDNCIGCFDVPSDVIVDPAGHVFVTGVTSSPPYSSDAILLLLDAATGLESDRGIVSGDATESVGSGILRFDGLHRLYDGAGYYDVNTGAIDMSVTRWPSLVAGGGDIPCEDTRRFQVRCVAGGGGNRLQARLTLTDASHDGEPATVEVDGAPLVLTIGGSRAQAVINGATPGAHSVELTDPAGCFPAETPVCPGE